MRKFFTFVCALALACGASAQTSEQLGVSIEQYPWNYTADPGTDISLAYTSQWGEFGVIGASNAINPADYKGYKLEYDADPTATAGEWIQVSIGQTSGQDQYNDVDPTATVLESDFNDNIKKYESLTKINLQAKAANVNLHVKGFYLVKEDGTEVQVKGYAGGGWGRNLGPSLAPSIVFTGQYGGLQIVTPAGESCTFKHATDKDVIAYYVVKLAEPLANTLMVEYDGASGGFVWNNYEAGVDELQFEVSAATASNKVYNDDVLVSETPTDIEKIYLKANADGGYPLAVNVKSIYRYLTSVSGISNPNSAVVANPNAPIFNLAGQKVSKAYKGVVIQNGKKFVQK